MKLFEDMFGLPYPLPKLDQVALPDFSGGMENWGLVLYKDFYLEFNEGVTSAASQQTQTEVVIHELAHQWFGNVVTMDYWDGLWLKDKYFNAHLIYHL